MAPHTINTTAAYRQLHVHALLFNSAIFIKIIFTKYYYKHKV